MKNNSVRNVVAVGIGSAIIMILMRFAVIPTGIPNTNIQTAYGFLALFAGIFGPIPAMLTGLIGHFLNDTMQYGSAWLSWVFCSGCLGLALGFTIDRTALSEGKFGLKETIRFNIVQVVANLIIWGMLAPALDVFIYSEPASKVFTQGWVAGISNAVSVGVIGTLLLKAYTKTQVQSGSLKKDA